MGSNLYAVGIILAVASVSARGTDLSSSNDAIAVEINGHKVSVAELEQKRPAAMFQARSNYFEAARRTVEDYVDEYLLEEQARKEGLTVAKLIEHHVYETIAKDPSEEVLRVYYEGADTTETYESVRDKLIDALRQRRIAKAKAAYLESLRRQAAVTVWLAPPRAPISTRDTVARGPANARVTLTEYADYECPYCQQVQPSVDKLVAEFNGTLAFTYKDFPLPMHPNSQKAAEASHCAKAQGRYWEYHDLLTTSKQLDPVALKNHARKLNLDSAAFDKCLDGGEMAEAVQTQAAEAQALGLQGTPSFFVNGRYISGALTYERLRAFILEELGTVERQSAAAREHSTAPK